MAKKRKTRKEKILSDRRHTQIPILAPSSSLGKEAPVVTPSYTYATDILSTKPQEKEKKLQMENQYAYVKRDLRKTGIITACIVVAELLLFFGIQTIR